MSIKSESESKPESIPVHPAVRARPWASKAKDLEEKEGSYGDYGAWEWWIENQVVKYGPDGAGDLLGDMDADNKVGLYVTMCRLADGDYTGTKGETMPDLTDAAKIEELGTTIYARGKEVPDVLNLIEGMHFTVIDELDKSEPKALEAIYEHAEPLGKAMQAIGMRLNRGACGDSHERNGEPLELRTVDSSYTDEYRDGEFIDASDMPCSLSAARKDELWLGCDNSRMHLTRPMVAALLPHLRRFVETGEL